MWIVVCLYLIHEVSAASPPPVITEAALNATLSHFFSLFVMDCASWADGFEVKYCNFNIFFLKKKNNNSFR